MKKVKRYIIAWLPVIIWCGIIFYFSNQSNLSAGLTPVTNFIIAKMAHIAEYFILTLLFYRALKMSRNSLEILRRLYFAGVLSLLYSMSDEFHQRFVMGRTPTLKDIAIDSCGIILAILFVKYSSGSFSRKRGS